MKAFTNDPLRTLAIVAILTLLATYLTPSVAVLGALVAAFTAIQKSTPAK